MRLLPKFGPRLLLALFALAAAGCFGPSSEELLAEARAAMRMQDFRTASIQLRTLLRREPEHLAALLLSAELAYGAGDPQLAERSFRRAADLGADVSSFWFHWLDALVQLERYPDALRRLADLTLTDDAGRARRDLLLGRARAGQGRDAEAEEAFRAALELDPALAIVHRDLARLYFRTGREARGEEELARGLARDPKHPEILLLHGLRRLSAGEVEEARAALERALDRAREQPALAAAVLTVLADAELALGRLEAAAERERELTKLLGHQPEVRYLRARLALEREDPERAREELQEALAVDKEFVPALRLLGAIHTLENQFELAEMYLQPAVAANPDDLYARRLLATVHLARGKPAEALPLLDEVDGSDPASEQALLAMRGRASLEIGDIARAARYYREGQRSFPDNPLFELGLSLTLLAEGRTQDAEEILRRLRGSEVEEVRSALLAMAALQVGRQEEAMASVDALLARRPDAPWAHNLRGSILMAAGRFEEARASFVRAVELQPGEESAVANLARVEQLLGNGDAALAAWERLLDEDPRNAEAALGYATLSLARGNASDALAALKPLEESSTRAQLLVAGILLDRGQPEAALSLAGRVAAKNADDAEAHNLLGLARLASGDAAGGGESFARAVGLRPGSALYQLNLARAAFAAGDEPTAEKALAAARRLDPSLPQLWQFDVVRRIREGDLAGARDALASAEGNDPALVEALRGELLLAEGHPAEAAARYTAAYRLRPSLELAARTWAAGRAASLEDRRALLEDWVARNEEDVRALRSLADAALHDGRHDRAVALYERVARITPDDLSMLNNLAWLYGQREDPRAIRLADRAVQLAPGNASVLDTAGWAHVRLGNRQRGLALLRDAASRAPGNGDIQFHLASALIQVGQAEEGRTLLVRLTESGAEFSYRDEAEALLRRM